MYISREIEHNLKSFLNRPEIIAIVGPRQAGKTTLLEQLRDQLRAQGRRVVWLNFERPTEVALFDDVERFAKLHCLENDVIIIDEFHFAREGGKQLKRLFDETKRKFIISGSSSLELTFQTGKYLVGRFVPFLLLPFSFREYVRAINSRLGLLLGECRFPTDPGFQALGGVLEADLQRAFEDYAVFGGYPAPAFASPADRRILLRALYDAYLLKDIRDLLQLATERELQRLANLLAGQVGNVIVYQELGIGAGMRYLPLKKHLHILENTYVLELLAPFFTNRRIELVKNPKVYFLDPGLRNAVLDAWSPISDRADGGALIEQCVFGGLRRYFSAPTQIGFWRSKGGAEVDFVVRTQDAAVPIEVKYQTSPRPGKSLISFVERYNPEYAYIATKGTSATMAIGKTKVRMVPAWYWA